MIETYNADNSYVEGTVVIAGGAADIMQGALGYRAIGVVKTSKSSGTDVIIKGQTPIRVLGPVSKGDRLIAFRKGTAISCENSIPGWINTDDEDITYDFFVFAVSLEDNDTMDEKTIKAFVL